MAGLETVEWEACLLEPVRNPDAGALLASRVERLTRAHPADVLITAPVRANLDPRFALEELPAREVRGVAEPVLTYAVRGFRDA